MLFCITEEVIQELEKGNKDVINALDHIAMAVTQGKHILYIERRFLDRILYFSEKTDGGFNGKHTHDLFKHIESKYSTYYSSIFNYINIKFYLTTEKNPRLDKTTEGYISSIYLPIVQFVDFEKVGKVTLIGENISEIEFYKFMCKYYLYKEKINIEPQYSETHGGGDTFAKVLEIQLNQGKLCLAFVDSDKKYPRADYDQTCKKVLGILDSKSWSNCFCEVVVSDYYREVENMIPWNVLNKICREDVNWKRGLNHFKKIQDSGLEISYLDMKEGFIKEKYKKCATKPTPFREYIENILINSGIIKAAELDKIKTEEKPTGAILQGLGSNVLDRSIKYLKENWNEWLKDTSLNEQKEQEWYRIGKIFFTWTCAYAPLRA